MRTVLFMIALALTDIAQALRDQRLTFSGEDLLGLVVFFVIFTVADILDFLRGEQ